MNMNNMQYRIPKSENRMKPETRIPKVCRFEPRISEFFRISILEFRISTWFNSINA